LKEKSFFEEQTEKILNEKTELAKREFLLQMKNLENENLKLKSELSIANDNTKSLKESLDEAYKTLIETKQEMQETINDKNSKL
jgi:phage shock protein A